jgi:hypothetical protein
VTKACWYDPERNPSYLDLARHFSLAILPTRPYQPRDKAAVEAADSPHAPDAAARFGRLISTLIFESAWSMRL